MRDSHLPCNNLGNIGPELEGRIDVSRTSKAARIQANQELLRSFYDVLHGAWGPQNWWPAESAFEMIVGAFLTQNTAWTNVERAIVNLRAADLLTVKGIRDVEVQKLEDTVRPAGYFRQKSARLKNFVGFLDANYGGSVERMLAEPTRKLRAELLALNGVGPETADSILLYAGNHTVFVVDSYTRRILHRHGVASLQMEYEAIRELWEAALSPIADTVPANLNGDKSSHHCDHLPSSLSASVRPQAAQCFNEMHALIVQIGKYHCRKTKPLCETCPLACLLPPKGPRSLDRAFF